MYFQGSRALVDHRDEASHEHEGADDQRDGTASRHVERPPKQHEDE